MQGAPSLHRAELPPEPSMRRRATPGTHGGAVGNRVSANAVGRRSSFLRARVDISPDTPLRARRKDDAGAPEGCARRPGMERRKRDSRSQTRLYVGVGTHCYPSSLSARSALPRTEARIGWAYHRQIGISGKPIRGSVRGLPDKSKSTVPSSLLKFIRTPEVADGPWFWKRRGALQC